MLTGGESTSGLCGFVGPPVLGQASQALSLRT